MSENKIEREYKFGCTINNITSKYEIDSVYRCLRHIMFNNFNWIFDDYRYPEEERTGMRDKVTSISNTLFEDIDEEGKVRKGVILKIAGYFTEEELDILVTKRYGLADEKYRKYLPDSVFREKNHELLEQ